MNTNGKKLKNKVALIASAGTGFITRAQALKLTEGSTLDFKVKSRASKSEFKISS